MKRLTRMILFYTAIIAIWVIVAKMRLWPPYMFPPPWGVWESLKTGFQDHSFWIAISTTMSPGYRLPNQPVKPGDTVKPEDTHSVTALDVKSVIAIPATDAKLKAKSVTINGAAWTDSSPVLVRNK